MAANPFTKHPHDIGESYGSHFRHAAWFGLTMLAGGAAALVHAVLPFVFVQTGSRTMAKLQRNLSGRIDRMEWERHPII